MAHVLYCAELRVKLESPFLFGGLFARDYGVDTLHERDHLGRPIIPYSEMRGLFRHAMTLMHPGEVDRLFGTAGRGSSDRGVLTFGDLALPEDVTSKRQTRVTIDAETGAAKEGHLQVVEIVTPIGEFATFCGSVHLLAKDIGQANKDVALLEDAKRLIRAAGALKTTGFGRVENIEVLAPQATTLCDLKPTKTTGDVVFEFEIDRPYLVGSDRVAANVMRGSSEIPGSALKGALANKLRLAGHDVSRGTSLGDVLAKVSVGHGIPWHGGDRIDPIAPLCAVSDQDVTQIFDASIDDEWADAKAEFPLVAFSTDWKKSLKCKNSATVTRTHIEIDPDQLAAKESQLFTHVLRLPFYGEEPVKFKSKITAPSHLSESEKGSFDLIKQALETGLFGIGKTRAMTQNAGLVDLKRPATVISKKLVRISLDTPHLMLGCTEAQTAASFLHWVKEYWHKTSDGSLQLAMREDHPVMFCDQDLAGGYMMSGYKAYGQTDIAPFLLMSAGSVFALKVLDPVKAKLKLDEWRRLGLPVGAVSGAKIDWDSCPFLPQNGYGAIEVDPDLSKLEVEQE